MSDYSHVRSALLRALPWIFALYAISLLISMAGMEIFSAFAAFFSLLVFFHDGMPTSPKKLRVVFWSLGILLLIVIVGCFVNTPRPFDPVKIIGSARWILLFYFMTFGMALTWSPKYESMFYFLCGMAAIIGLYALFQHYTGIDFIRHNHDAVQPFGRDSSGRMLYRACGFIGGPMRYGHATSITLCYPLAALLLGLKRNWKWKAFLSFVLLCLVIGLWTTSTRGAWLGALAGVFTIGLFLNRRVFAGLVIGCSVLIGTMMVASPRFRNRVMISFNLQNPGIQSRFTIWRGNWAMFRDYPILGIGYNENERLIPLYYKKLGITNGQQGHAHNNYFQYLSGTGITGFTCYMLFIIFCFLLTMDLWRKTPKENVWERTLALASLGAQVANAVGGLTECNFKDAEVRHLFLFMLCVTGALYWRRFGRLPGLPPGECDHPVA